MGAEPAEAPLADPAEEPETPETPAGESEEFPVRAEPEEGVLEAPVEQTEAADDGEDISEEAEHAVPEGLVIEDGVVTGYTGNAEDRKSVV